MDILKKITNKVMKLLHEMLHVTKYHLQVAYFGADLSDLDCIKSAGVGGTPANSDPEVYQYADYNTLSTGGNGAIGDFCKYLIKTCCISEKSVDEK